MGDATAHTCFFPFLENVTRWSEKVRETLHLFSPELAHHLNHKCLIASSSVCFVNVSFFPTICSEPTRSWQHMCRYGCQSPSTLPVHIPTHLPYDFRCLMLKFDLFPVSCVCQTWIIVSKCYFMFPFRLSECKRQYWHYLIFSWFNKSHQNKTKPTINSSC